MFVEESAISMPSTWENPPAGTIRIPSGQQSLTKRIAMILNSAAKANHRLPDHWKNPGRFCRMCFVLRFYQLQAWLRSPADWPAFAAPQDHLRPRDHTFQLAVPPAMDVKTSIGWPMAS